MQVSTSGPGPSKTKIFLINLGILAAIFALAELGLRLFTPFNVATIGHQFAANSQRYGWGYNPYEQIKILDPDTGQTYFSHANNHGWRDLDRRYDNPRGAYRILVLGDSVTFGAIVPDDKIYTRRLEDKLRQGGYNAEIINIAYGGWGTDQELEALVNEGLKYGPNLIIVQFTKNDIMDNAYYYHATQDERNLGRMIDWKPFYYELDSQNRVHRQTNPHYKSSADSVSYATEIKNILLHFEISKHLYAVYLTYKYRQGNIGYRATDNQLLQLKTVVGLRRDSALYQFLQEHKGQSLDLPALDRAIRSSGLLSRQEAIHRILEDRWFTQYWDHENYFPARVEGASYDWRLYFGLVREIKRQAGAIGAEVAVFPETEEGSYAWSLSWYRVQDGVAAKANYLSHLQVMKTGLAADGIDLIDNTRPYERARNDPHPNVAGNQAMADDIWQYLMRRKHGELAGYRRQPGAAASASLPRTSRE